MCTQRQEGFWNLSQREHPTAPRSKFCARAFGGWPKCARLVQSPGEPRTLSLKRKALQVAQPAESCRRCVQSDHMFKHVLSYF